MNRPALGWAEWARHDAVSLAALVRTRQISAEEAVVQAVAAARLLDPQLAAVLETFDDLLAKPQADGADPGGPLWGVPMFVKDLGSGIAGRLSEQGSALTMNRRCTRTDPLIANLHEAGLIVAGRAATAELGMAYDTTTTYRGLRVTRNPWNLAHTPGGSSGGSAALVAAGVVPLAHATDGAGSTRIPAGLTGLIGLKVSRGRLPLPWHFNEYGNATFGEGVVTRTVRDAAAFLDAGSRHFPAGKGFVAARHDAASFAAALAKPPARLRIAISSGKWGHDDDCHPLIAARTREVAIVLERLGHTVEEIRDEEITDWHAFWPAFRIFWAGVRPATWGLAHGGALPPEIEAALSPMTRAFWLQAQRHDKHDMLRHQAVNNLHALRMAQLFERCDVLLTPVLPITAPLANGALSLAQETDFDAYVNALLSAGRYAIPANDAGLPVVSVPAGKDDGGLPVGVQLCGSWLAEGQLLQLAAQLEAAVPEWFGAVPRVHVSRLQHLPQAMTFSA